MTVPIRVGLVADPAAPAEIARRLSDLESPDGADQAWDIEVVTRAVHHRFGGRGHRGGATGGLRSTSTDGTSSSA